jgi:hypothetical protein
MPQTREPRVVLLTGSATGDHGGESCADRNKKLAAALGTAHSSHIRHDSVLTLAGVVRKGFESEATVRRHTSPRPSLAGASRRGLVPLLPPPVRETGPSPERRRMPPSDGSHVTRIPLILLPSQGFVSDALRILARCKPVAPKGALDRGWSMSNLKIMTDFDLQLVNEARPRGQPVGW